MTTSATPALPQTQISNQSPQPATPASTQPDFIPSDAQGRRIAPDGGELGRAALGALKGATEAHSSTPSSVPDFIPSDEQGNPIATPKPSIWNTIKEDFTSNPISNAITKTLSKPSEWAEARRHANLIAASEGKPLPYSENISMLLDEAGTTGRMLGGMTQPKNLAILPAAEVAPTITGMGLVGHGLYNMVKGWGDLTNPDILQNELSSAAEVAGGAAMSSAGAKNIRSRITSKAAAQSPDNQYVDFKNAVPPSKSTPYTELDYHAARPYLENEHISGTPITDVQSTVDAADSAIGKIEGTIGKVIQQNPNIPVPIDVIKDVQNVLQDNIRKSFLDQGLKELNDYPLDKPLTLETADTIRRQLNDDNRSMMKAKNNYDIASMMSTDPAFAARQAAAESLRAGIYNTLQKLGLPDAQQMRLDEGSVIKIRNAAQSKIFNSDKAVRTGKQLGKVRKFVKSSLGPIGAAAGFEVGATMGHPVLGAGAGARVGEAIGEQVLPKSLTRDQLIERAFESKPASSLPAPSKAITTAGAASAASKSEKPKEHSENLPILFEGYSHIRTSDGKDYYIPTQHLDTAKKYDAGLQLIKQAGFPNPVHTIESIPGVIAVGNSVQS